MRQAQMKMSERKARRKRMALAVILLGHRVKSPVTVIFLDGALSVSIFFVNRYICSSGSRPAHRSRFFYDIGNCSAILCHKNTLRVRMRTRMRGSIASAIMRGAAKVCFLSGLLQRESI